jgi:predicted peroxiredoxin
MADSMVYVGSYAMDDPYRAALVFAAANAMADYAKKHQFALEVHVALLGDGVFLMKDEIAKSATPHPRHPQHPQKRPPLFDLITDAVAKGVKIHY